MWACIRILWRGISLFLMGLLALVLLFLLSGFILSSIPVNRGYAQSQSPDSIEIFVTSNGVHTDIVVPVATPHRDWRQLLPLHHYGAVDSSYRYVAFGWGDRRFYMQTPEWTDLTPNVAFTAALWPTRTAMHVEYIQNKLIPTKRQRPILISAEQYRQLIAYIDASFVRQQGQYTHIPNSGYTPHDTFYEAHGRFYLLKNCNNWVNQGLKSMNVRAPLWAPFPYAIMRHLR